MTAISPRVGAPAADRTRAPADGVAMASEVALALLTVVSAATFGRLFRDGSFLPRTLLAALAAHAVAAICRRTRLHPVATVAISTVSVFVLVGWLVFPETTTAGIPWTGTWTAMREALSGATSQFREVVAPATVSDGFLTGTVVGAAVAAYLADWAAFRIGATFESTVPSFTLFVFSAYLGTDRHELTSVAGYGAALLLYVALHHARLQAASASWFASASGGAAPSLLRGSAAIGGVALAAALLVGPNLPGADDKAVISRDGGPQGGGSRTTVSPLVDIRGRLVDNSDIEVFSVRADNRSYWRLTSLDTFDGDIWSSNESYRPERGRLPDVQPDNGSDVLSNQEFKIESLASIWLPAAFEPERISGVDGVSYSSSSASLISRFDTTDGLEYSVQSRMPRPTPDELGAAAVNVVPSPRYTALPPISRRVTAEALRVAGQGTPYERALALQRYFRGGAFRYDLRVTQGHGGDALVRFLFQTKRGYCEQFAGAYAVMARSVGLPARVAVGFTPGEIGDDGRYHVRALNAHAWPEVFIAGAGWVAFEPTPGRGMPGAEAYTGVPEAQASAENPTTATTSPPTTAPSGDQPGEGATTTVSAPTDVDAGGGAGGAPGFVRRLAVPVLVVIALVGAYAVLVPVLKRQRRARRRTAARTPSDRVLVAWADANDALAQAGLRRSVGETPAEYATRVSRTGRLPERTATELMLLAGDTAAAAYAAGGADGEVAQRADQAAASVSDALRSRATRWERARWALDPRELVDSDR